MAKGFARPDCRLSVRPRLSAAAHEGRRRSGGACFRDGSWIAEARARGPLAVGVAFGLRHDERTEALGPCPACGAEKRHPSRRDRRGAIGLTRDGVGWRCFQCDASGDAVALAALLAIGRLPAKGDHPAWRRVRGALAERGLCEPEPRGGALAPVVRLPPPVPRVPTPPTRPPGVRAAWSLYRPVTEDPEVSDGGSWAEEIAARIPDGLTVKVRTHRDKKGHEYADRIVETLVERCQVCRFARDGA